MEEEEFKIKVYSPTNKSIADEIDHSGEIKKTTANFHSNLYIEHTNTKSQGLVKDIFQCEISRLNSCGSDNSLATDFFPFEDPINESLEDSPLVKRESRKNKSKFLEIELEKVRNSQD